jgi:hypothetical protein
MKAGYAVRTDSQGRTFIRAQVATNNGRLKWQCLHVHTNVVDAMDCANERVQLLFRKRQRQHARAAFKPKTTPPPQSGTAKVQDRGPRHPWPTGKDYKQPY